LEYRGYDSAGIALLEGKEISVTRSEGKLGRLATIVESESPKGRVGIGHTRWATHGRPSEKNAHPHRAGNTVLVHNGIIENYLSLKERLEEAGHKIISETDSEIICHLIEFHAKTGLPFFKAYLAALEDLEGTYALAVINADEERIYAAKKGSPLVIGLGENENFIASDIPAILPYTDKVVFLEDHEVAIVSATNAVAYDKKGNEIKKTVKKIEWSSEMAEKGGYKHFMLKEIMEQPRVIADTLIGRVFKGSEKIELDEIAPLFKGKVFPFFERIYLIACGTSWHAAMAGKYYIEAIAKVPVNVDTASEFRYREPFVTKKTLILAISQSGETADTLACIQDAKLKGATVISICNVIDSSIPRASDATLYTHAGPEIGVASTKAFTTQLAVLLMIALYLGKKGNRIDSVYIKKAVHQLAQLPNWMEEVLAKRGEILKIAEKYHQARDFYFLARGVHFPIALEGALKLKEISYVHAEGYAAGEMKHGPIALIEEGTPVVALAPQDRVCTKMISNIQEVKARGASVIAIATVGDSRFNGDVSTVFSLPRTAWYITPFLASLPLQLLAYYVSDLKGTDVDQPRNLAKSVTVE
ncbi:MAG: glutamine--fructose-6-phosphate transaminase (isomerizing), partial [Deltaproteobacteria bacterium]|nr:glutamine--fructose-6-phosphate transaminase (isomerizing) [Deltaproteobacteria bacterium]